LVDLLKFLATQQPNEGELMRQAWTITLIFLVFMAVGCSRGSLTTREKGAGIGAFGGAAVGGIIGAAYFFRPKSNV
jgi:uncharacterized protein YqgC (DUF456 family)